MVYQEGLTLRIRVAVGFIGILAFLFGLAALVIALTNRNDEHFLGTLTGGIVLTPLGFLLGRWGNSFKTKAQAGFYDERREEGASPAGED
jgi:uncharacterized membrane protein HdeD (DUF308 family)